LLFGYSVGLFISQLILSIKGAIRMGTQKATSGAKPLRAKDILTNAADTITERGATHGHYDITMLRTAQLWSTFLERELDPTDVAVCMALVKLARIMETRNVHDSWLDAVAYFAIAGELAVKDWNDLDAY
jgi:hypothetical protein